MKGSKRFQIIGIAAAAVLAGAAIVYFTLIQPMLDQSAAYEAALDTLNRQAEISPAPTETPALPSPTPVGPYRERIARYYDAKGKLKLLEATNFTGVLVRKETDDERLEYTYDEAGNLISYSKYNGDGDRLLDKKDYHYDAEGRVLEEIDYSVTDGKTKIWEQNSTRYDELGNEISYESRSADGTLKRSDVYTYTYDDAGHILKCVYVYTDPTEGKSTETTTNRYDGNGNLISSSCVCKSGIDYVSSYNDQTRYEYDEMNRCIKETTYYNGSIDGYCIYEYDENDVCRKSTSYQPDGTRGRITEYDENGVRIDADGVENEYDEDGVRIRSFEEYSSTAVRQTDYFYNEYGLLVREEYTLVDSGGETEKQTPLGYRDYEYIYE